MNAARWIERPVVPWLWLVFVVAMALQVASWWFAGPPLDTDILALLPAAQSSPEADRARQRLVDSGRRRLVALVGGESPEHARNGAEAYLASLKRAHAPLDPDTMQRVDAPSGAETYYARYQHALLSAAHRRELEGSTTDNAVRRALSWLYSPLSVTGGPGFAEDPFRLFAGWLADRAASSRVRPRDGRLMIEAEGKHYVLLPMTLDGSPFDREIQDRLLPALQTARKEAEGAADRVEVLEAGVALHAAAATRQARREISFVGGGSLAGILLLIWLSFSSLRATWLAQLPVAVGVLSGLAACSLLLGRVHVLTLVFGASLLGVAIDYSLHALCQAASDDRTARFQRFRDLLPGMVVAWGSTSLAYLAFAIPDFPALRQMALFSVTGLLASWATVLFWFPRLMRGGLHTDAAPVRLIHGMHQFLNGIGKGARVFGALVVFSLAVPGFLRLQANDDIRLLQSSPPVLIEQQVQVSRLAGLPAAGQFLLVRGENAQALLETEEALRSGLDELQREGLISGYQAVSQWLPSIARQQRDHSLIGGRLYGPQGALIRLAGEAGLDEAWIGRVRAAHDENTGRWLEPRDWLSSGVSEPFRPLWLGCDAKGCASVVLIRGIRDRAGLDALGRAAAGLQGVEWVDVASDISTLLGRYRTDMMEMFAAAFALILAALLWRYRAGAWRIVAPTLLGSVLTLATFGWLGIEINLFVVLALILVLGMGLDYGVYLYEGDRQAVRSWTGVSLSALTTLLGFGLLTTSRTPALHAFGLTMLLGITLAWVLAGLMNRTRPPAADLRSRAGPGSG